MKQFIKYSSIVLVSLISSNVLADWVIPGNRCVVTTERSYTSTEVGYNRSAIGNPSIRPSNNNDEWLRVVCSTPAHINYGKYLDVDFVVENNSDDQDLSCQAFTFDADNNLVQNTIGVSTGKGRKKLKATQFSNYSNTTPVTFRAICSLPDRGLNGRHSPSKLISIRVY